MRQQDVLIAPWISEKTTSESERNHAVVFNVAKAANKQEIRQAVEQMYAVKVASVRTLITHGKIKRKGKSIGRQSARKKAVVTLKEGSNIDFYQQAE